MLAWGLAISPLLEQGQRLYQQNRFRDARLIFTRALEQSPRSPELRLWLGYTELALGELGSAIVRLEPLEKDRESDPEYLYALSEAYTREARNLSDRIASLGEGSARAHQLLAYRYRAEGDTRNAEAEFRRAVALRPDAKGLHLDLADLLWEQKRYEEAADALRSELLVQPLDFLANLRYGQFLLRERDCGAAEGPLRIAARHRRYPEAYQLLAYALEKCGKPLEAQSVVASGLIVFPENADLLELSRRIRGAGAKPWTFSPLSEARPDIDALRKRVSGGSASEDDLFELSQHYSQRGQVIYERLARVAPESHRTIQIQALNAEYAGDLTTAEKLYRKVIESKPSLAGAHYSLGHVLIRQGKEEEGIAELEKEESIDPQNHLALFELGSSLLKQGRTEPALRRLKSAVELKPTFVEAKLELARAYLQKRVPTRAAELLEEVVAAQPTHSSAHFLLYRAYAAAGQQEKARQHLTVHQKLLESRRAVRSDSADQPC
jgi:predicted Zn-dependent protease